MSLINRKSIAFKIISATIMIVLSVILTKFFLKYWKDIPFEELTFNYWYLSLAFLFSIINPAISAVLWQYILRLLNEKPRFIDCWRINTYSQIARYLPGKVWQYMGKIYWGKKLGMSEKRIILSTLLETIFLMGGAFVISLFSIKLFIDSGYIHKGFLIFILLMTIFTVIALHPRFLEIIINTFGKKWIKNPITLKFSFLHVIIILLFYILQWLTLGLQFYFFIYSFYELTFNHFIFFCSINAASWLIGFLSIIAPSGMVVREGVFVFGFKMLVPVSFAIMCAIFLRLFGIVTEVLITAIFFILDKGAWKNFFDLKKNLIQ